MQFGLIERLTVVGAWRGVTVIVKLAHESVSTIFRFSPRGHAEQNYRTYKRATQQKFNSSNAAR